MKRIIALLMALVMAAITFSVTAFAREDENIPVIMIGGRAVTTEFFSADGEKVFPITGADTEFIVSAVMKCLPELGRGLATGNLEKWATMVADVMAPLYEKFIPDKNGDVELGSGPKKQCGRDSQFYTHSDEVEYRFYYDWREDPFVSAEELQGYIDNIKEHTGCEKVSLIGRCYGGSVITAYLEEYGHKDIDTVVHYASTINGATAVSKIFSNQFELNMNNLEQFLNTSEIIEDPALSAFISATLSYINSVNGLDMPVGAIEKLISEKLWPALAPKLLPVCYGRLPSYWAMIEAEDYEAAKELVFGENNTEYAQFIEKIDRFQQARINAIDKLKEYESEGLNVAVVTKYNKSLAIPVVRTADVQGDDTVKVEFASLGAVSAKLGEKLPKAYIEEKDEKYISSDNIIDASTCAFPESTWFIKDLNHDLFPDNVDRMMNIICKHNGQMTVDDNPLYPRFMSFTSDGELIPLNDSPAPDKLTGNARFIELTWNFIKAFFGLIISLFS